MMLFLNFTRPIKALRFTKALLTATLIGLSPLHAADEQPPADKNNFHIFLLMGQSNMVGYGGVPKNDPLMPEDTKPVPGVLMLSGQGSSLKSAEPVLPVQWHPAKHPLHDGKNGYQSHRFGLGLPFAKEYLKTHPGVTVGLIPCAWGGAPIGKLGPGSPLFENSIARMRFASQQGVIKGALWQQGESDSVSPNSVNSYEAKLRNFIQTLRKEAQAPEMPFIIGNLAEFYGQSPDHAKRIDLINQVRDILKRVATTEPNCAFVSTAGLEDSQGALVHFNRKSLIILGQRHAAALQTLEKPTP